MEEKEKPVLITTEHRGVFFGYVTDEELSKAPERVTIKNARNCVRWSSSTRGVFGLAAKGPSKECRIGLSVPELTVWKITSVTRCTDEAAKAWEDAPWG